MSSHHSLSTSKTRKMPQYSIGIKNLNLNLCFTKFKFPLHLSQILSGAKPTTPLHNHSRPSPTAATSSNGANHDLTIVRNFNSLYSSSGTDVDAATAAASSASSRRFFIPSPGRSNSIVDSSSSSPAAAGCRDGGVVAVPTLSPDPYADFRRSMQEMVEARELAAAAEVKNDNNNNNNNKKSNWEFLHELLLCYLALNPKSTHKFIIGAFSDLVVGLNPPENGVAAAADSDIDHIGSAIVNK